MLKLKRAMAVMLVLGLALGLAFSGVDQAAAAEHTFKLSHEVVEGSLQDLYARKLKEYVEDATGGKVQIQIFIANQLGDPVSVVESIQNGTIELGVINTGSSGTILKDFNIFNIPMLFPRDMEKIHKVFNSGIIPKLAVNAEKMGMVALRGFSEPFMQVTANKPVRTPEDIQGLKIRVMNSPMLIATYQALGANPTPIPFSEVYSSLQMGIVDAQENPFDIVNEMAYYEVQDYLMTTRHSIPVNICWMNKRALESLPEDIRQAFVEGGRVAQDYLFGIVPEVSEKNRKALEEKGMEIIEPDQSLIDAYKAASSKAEEEYIKLVGEETGKAHLSMVKEAIEMYGK